MKNIRNSIDIIKHTLPHFAFANFVLMLQKELKDCDSVLDVGCGSASALRFISGKQTYGVDGHAPSIAISKKHGIHNKYGIMDVRELDKKFKNNQFDAVMAIDVIEHLTPKEGYELLKQMEKIAAKKVIIVTPNGFVPQSGHDNQLQEHISGWDAADFTKRGYKVKGLYGLKMFRGERAELKFKPKLLTGIISELTHYLYTHRRPEKSYSLFAVYNKK